MNDIYFRIRAIERNIARGVQSAADLEDVKAHGRVTRPCEDISHTLTRAYVVQVEAGKRLKKDIG